MQNRKRTKFAQLILMLLISVAFFSIKANAQIGQSKNTKQTNSKDTLTDQNVTKIIIEKSDNLIGIKNSSDGYFNKFVGNVQVRSDDIVMTCDSAFLNEKENKLKAFGNVDIMKGGTSSAKANYVEYTGNTSQTYMKDNVQIFDNGNQIITDDLNYNLKSKIGIYKNSGTLVSDGTTISSDYGNYNGRNKQSYFKGNVFITHEDADIESKELAYNTDSKIIKFLDLSTIYGKDAVIVTYKGKYNQKTGIAEFSKRTKVENSEQIITADKIKYNEKTGSGSARGDVIIVDKNENTVLNCDAANYDKSTGYGIALGHIKYQDSLENMEMVAGKVEYNEFNDFLVATNNPLLTTITDNDSILIAADTMLALRATDINKIHARFDINGKSTFKMLHIKQEESFDDKKIIICDNHVQVYGDSMQAVCDSMIYRQTDSIFNLYQSPVVWSSNQQAEGDTIFLYMENNKIRKSELRNNSFIINDTEYPKMYNQIKGRNIDAFFENNAIQRALVKGGAQSIYYAENEDKKYLGLNRASGSIIKILFENKEIHRIVFYEEPSGAFFPMEKIEEKDRFLEGFTWRSALRPKSRFQLRNRSIPDG